MVPTCQNVSCVTRSDPDVPSDTAGMEPSAVMVIEEECSQLFRSLGRMCVLDVHVGQTDVPTESPEDVPRKSLPPSLMSPGEGELVRTTVTEFPRMDATLGDTYVIGREVMTVRFFPG